jgi:predicted acyltransferase (DUF342 family)
MHGNCSQSADRLVNGAMSVKRSRSTPTGYPTTGSMSGQNRKLYGRVSRLSRSSTSGVLIYIGRESNQLEDVDADLVRANDGA